MVEERRREKPDMFADYAQGIVRSLDDDLLSISSREVKVTLANSTD